MSPPSNLSVRLLGHRDAMTTDWDKYASTAEKSTADRVRLNTKQLGPSSAAPSGRAKSVVSSARRTAVTDICLPSLASSTYPQITLALVLPSEAADEFGEDRVSSGLSILERG